MRTFGSTEEKNPAPAARDADENVLAQSNELGLPNPEKAALLSLLPGLGQLYIGETFRGSLFLCVSIVNLSLLVAMAAPLFVVGIAQQIGSIFHLQVNPDFTQPLEKGGNAGFALVIWSMLYASYVLFAVREAYGHAIRLHRGRKFAPQGLPLPEAVSGSYLFHWSFMACCLLVLLFVVAPKPPQEQATDIELVQPPPPAPPKPKSQPKPEPPKPVHTPPLPKPVQPTPPPKATPVAVAVPSKVPTPDAVAPATEPAPPAPPAAPSGPPGPPSSEGSGSSQDVDYGPYLSTMQRRIKKAWFPPKGNESKTVTLKFRIHTSGEVSDIRMVKSSGVSQVDDAATQAVQTAAPFPPLPAGAPDAIDIKFTFDYNVFNGGSGSRFRQF